MTRSKGSVISNFFSEWLEHRRRAKLRAKVIEGCREMADVYREVLREWEPLDAEMDRKLDA
jgi:hypothetical protein